MRKLNMLKSILDFLWIVSIPLIPILIILLPAMFFVESLEELPFKLNGQNFTLSDNFSKIILVMVLLSYLILLYCLFLFRAVLRYFQELKMFDLYVIDTMKKIGNLLIFSAFLSAVPTFVYKFIYKSRLEIDLSFSPFILTISLGLFFMVLSEVFKIAKNLKQENELTI